MKFSELYNKVFVNEQSINSGEDEVAVPGDVEVEGAPVPSPEQNPEENGSTETPDSSSNLSSFRDDIKSFIDKLNGEQSSLETLLVSIDKHGTPWDGISDELNSDILRASEALSDIVIAINSRFNNAAKNPTVS